MIKRISDIASFPFYLIYLLISFPFKIIIIIINDKAVKRSYKESRLSVKINDDELFEIGTILFPEFKIDFKTFFDTFQKDRKGFLVEFEKLLDKYDNLELNKLKPIEFVYIFGDSKGKLSTTDWRGEENEREIEYYIENKLQIKTNWYNVNEIRKGVDQETQRDGKFIIELLKTIDKDLEPLNKRLVFLDLGWDAYVYTVIDQVSDQTITDKFVTYFYGTEKLSKLEQLLPTSKL
jgi:hypothetical protein